MSSTRAAKVAWRGLVVLSLILFGCGKEHLPRPCPECPVPVLSVEDAGACADWRWIGIKRPSPEANPKQPALLDPCPPAEGWAVRHLFCPETRPARGGGGDTKQPRAAEDCGAEALPPGLQPFCLYEALVPRANLETKPPAGLASVARDCMAVHPQATPLTQRLLPVLEAQFLDQAGQPREQPVAVPADPEAPRKVRLALLDTAPTNPDDPEARPANSPHGPTLASMAKRLLCGASGSACDLRVTARLALAYLGFDPRSKAASARDEARGGYVGFVGELAEAIREEVVAWQGSGEERLVLNLSVGWRRGVGGTLPPADQAVRAALQDAYCRGALALAAAGNREWGPDKKLHTGPLLPAAWEQSPAPSVAECIAALGIAAPPVTDPDPWSYRPLLGAVGAVDAGGQPLANARFGAEPRLVAFGDHGVVKDARTGEPTAVLTGSSVSTLVVSAAAAAVLSADPRLEPRAVLDRLYRRGPGLGGRGADFCQGSGDPGEEPCPAPGFEVSRVYLCASLDQGCPPGSAGAPSVSASAGAAAGGRLRLKIRDLPGFAGVRVRNLQALRRDQRSKACPPPWLARVAARPRGDLAEVHHPRGTGPSRYPCPYWQLPGVYASAALGPQPGSDPCPPCGFGSGSPGTLVVEIDPDFEGRLSAPTLKVGRQSYPLNLGSTVPVRAIVENVPYEPGEEVLLSFVLDGNRSVTSALLVFERDDS